MKKVLVAVFGMAMILTMTACPVTPPDGDGLTPLTPKITIYVKLSATDNATNIYDSVGGATNSLFGAGDFGGLKVNSVVIPTWDPTSAVAQLTRVSADMFKLELVNDLTNNASLSFKFVNGSAGFGGTWANEEQEWMDDHSGYEGIANRSLDIIMGVSTNIYMTNDVVSNVGGAAMGCIEHWKGVGPTYTCTNVSVTLVFVNNLITNDTGNGTNIAVGAPLCLAGSFNGYTTGMTNALAADDSITFAFTYVSGPASIAFVVVTPQLWGAQTAYDNAGVDFGYAIPYAMAVSGTIVVTNTGYWKFW
jgi:hypothetical protein